MSAGIRKEMGRAQLKAELKAEAERQAQPSPQPAEDLDRVLGEIDKRFQDAETDSGHHEFRVMRARQFEEKVWQHWPTIRAVLARERKLEDVIAHMDREVEGHIELIVETQRERDVALAWERELREALRDGAALVDAYGEALNPQDEWEPCYLREWKQRVKALLAQPAAGEERERG